MSFNLIQSLNEQKDINDVAFLKENTLLTEHYDIGHMLHEGTNVVMNESVKEFVKDAREFLKFGNFPSWQRKQEPDDEQPDNEINHLDKILYLAKVVAGLFYYMKSDLKNKDDAAFDQLVSGLTTTDMVDDNVKAQAEKMPKLKQWVGEVEKNFKNPSTKKQIEKYLGQIEEYFA